MPQYEREDCADPSCETSWLYRPGATRSESAPLPVVAATAVAAAASARPSRFREHIDDDIHTPSSSNLGIVTPRSSDSGLPRESRFREDIDDAYAVDPSARASAETEPRRPRKLQKKVHWRQAPGSAESSSAVAESAASGDPAPARPEGDEDGDVDDGPGSGDEDEDDDDDEEEEVSTTVAAVKKVQESIRVIVALPKMGLDLVREAFGDLAARIPLFSMPSMPSMPPLPPIRHFMPKLPPLLAKVPRPPLPSWESVGKWTGVGFLWSGLKSTGLAPFSFTAPYTYWTPYKWKKT